MFVLDNTANLNGCHLLSIIDVDSVRLLELFGEPKHTGESEKGYLSEYVFRATDGQTVTLYDRWGQWRIGGKDQNLAKEFKTWLFAKLAKLPTITERLIESLDNMTASMETVMVWYGEKMSPEDRLSRMKNIQAARSLLTEIRKPLETNDALSSDN